MQNIQQCLCIQEEGTCLLSDCDALDVRAEVEPESEQARQRLEDVAVPILDCQAVVAYDLGQDL
jgi:hypothetical protein